MDKKCVKWTLIFDSGHGTQADHFSLSPPVSPRCCQREPIYCWAGRDRAFIQVLGCVHNVSQMGGAGEIEGGSEKLY